MDTLRQTIHCIYSDWKEGQEFCHWWKYLSMTFLAHNMTHWLMLNFKVYLTLKNGGVDVFVAVTFSIVVIGMLCIQGAWVQPGQIYDTRFLMPATTPISLISIQDVFIFENIARLGDKTRSTQDRYTIKQRAMKYLALW